MNARPYILGCLCLVGATGTAAASDIDPTNGLLSLSSSAAAASFEGGARSPQGGRGDSGGDVMSSHAANASQRSSSPAPVPAPADPSDGPHDDMMPSRSTAPSWQSMLPGSML